MTGSPQTASRALSTISVEGFKRAAQILDNEAPIGPRTQLLPAEVCKRVIERIDVEPARCDRSDATDFVAALLRCYPDFRAHDAKGYALALFDLFAAYPRSIGSRIVDPVSGLPSRLKFTPKIADVKEALEAEVKRRALIRANAVWHMREKERRDEERAKEAEFERNRPSAEQRAEQVRLLLGSLTVKTVA